jgi:hypothetical protein
MILCPHCGHRNRKTIAWLRLEMQFTCIGCGNVSLKVDEFRRAIEQADKSMGHFRRAHGNLGRY